ncbi:MAG TPA: hypothetical protein VGP44_08305 [Gemmatimonadales bacterium]|nr:hypothetical protein [Gemmatimonadales bacterium]
MTGAEMGRTLRPADLAGIDPRDGGLGEWTEAQQQEVDLRQIEQSRIYRTLRAALRREPTPRELWRAREAFYSTNGTAA